VFVIIADESRRAEALTLVQTCRELGLSTDFPLKPAKIGKQFQEAEHLGARYAVLVGQEWPQIKLKHLPTRTEESLDHTALAPKLKTYKLHS
jgi:histidyl-tRNA synthetase